MQTILVTGATGAIGPSVVGALHREKYGIRVFANETPAAGLFPESVEVMLGDIADTGAVESAMVGVDAVIHMAALLHASRLTVDMYERYKLVNIEGTERVVRAAVQAAVKRIVLFSTIAVYGPTGGSVFNEQSPTQPETFYAQTKLEAERIVLNARSSEGQPLGTVLRLGAVYGARVKGNYRRLVHDLAHNRFVRIGNGLNQRTLVYDKDVGRAVILAISHPAAAGKVFNVTDGDFHTVNEIVDSICSALGRKPPRLLLPVEPMRALAGLIEKGSFVFGVEPSITPEMISKYTEDVRVDGSLIQRELGFMPQYGLRAGWAETVRLMQP